MSRVEADRTLREAMGDLGTARLRRWLMWSAVTPATIVAGVGPGTDHRHIKARNWHYRLAALGSLAAIGVLGIVATLDIVDRWIGVLWIPDRGFGGELLWGVLGVVVIPAALSILWWRLRPVGMIAGIALGLMLHVTLAVLALTILFQTFEFLARWKREPSVPGAVSPRQRRNHSGVTAGLMSMDCSGCQVRRPVGSRHADCGAARHLPPTRHVTADDASVCRGPDAIAGGNGGHRSRAPRMGAPTPWEPGALADESSTTSNLLPSKPKSTGEACANSARLLKTHTSRRFGDKHGDGLVSVGAAEGDCLAGDHDHAGVAGAALDPDRFDRWAAPHEPRPDVARPPTRQPAPIPASRVPDAHGDVEPRLAEPATVADHLADGCRTSVDGGQYLTPDDRWVNRYFDKTASSYRQRLQIR